MWRGGKLSRSGPVALGQGCNLAASLPDRLVKWPSISSFSSFSSYSSIISFFLLLLFILFCLLSLHPITLLLTLSSHPLLLLLLLFLLFDHHLPILDRPSLFVSLWPICLVCDRAHLGSSLNVMGHLRACFSVRGSAIAVLLLWRQQSKAQQQPLPHHHHQLFSTPASNSLCQIGKAGSLEN